MPAYDHPPVWRATLSLSITLLTSMPAGFRVGLLRLVLLSCAATQAGPLHAAEDPLTLGAAQDRAVIRSAGLEAARESVESSRATLQSAGELPDPTFRFGVENLPAEGVDRFSLDRDFMTMQRVGLMQEFTRPEKRRLRSQRAGQAVRVAEAQRVEAATLIRRLTALAWLDVYYADAVAMRMAQLVAVGREHVTAAEAAYREGRGNAAEVVTARGELVVMEDDSEAAALDSRTARIALSRWIGADAAALALAERPPIDALPFAAAAVEAHLRAHPDLESLIREEELALTEVDLARAERRPDWSVELAYGRRGSAFGDMLSIGVAVPIPVNRADRQDRTLAARLAEARRAEALRRDAFAEHLAETQALLKRWESTRDRRIRLMQTLVPLATDRVTTATAAYRGGQASLADVVAALRNQTDVDIKIVELEAKTAALWAQLTFLVPAAGEQ